MLELEKLLCDIFNWITESIEKHIRWTVSLISVSISSAMFFLLLHKLSNLIFQYDELGQVTIILILFVSCFSTTIVVLYIIIRIINYIKDNIKKSKKWKKQAMAQKSRCKKLYPEEIWNIIIQLVNNENVEIKIDTHLYELFEAKGFVYPALASGHWMIVAQNGGFEFIKKEENIDDSDLTETEKKNRDSDFENNKPYGLRYVRLQEQDYTTIKEFCFVKKHKKWISVI